MSKFKLVLFDMDGTLLKDRTIFVFAEKKGFMDDLKRLFYSTDLAFYQKNIEIAKLLKGLESRELLEIFRKIKLNKNVKKVIKELKKRGLKTAIVTASYQIFADDLKKRLGMDYAFANNLMIKDGIVTGKLIINNKNLLEEPIGKRVYSICKSNVLDQLCEKLGITPDEVIAVGDGGIDICMLEKAGLGVAFNASVDVQKHANISIDDMSTILKYVIDDYK